MPASSVSPRSPADVGFACADAAYEPFSGQPGDRPFHFLAGAIDGTLRGYSTKDWQVVWEYQARHDFETVNGVPAKGGSIDAGAREARGTAATTRDTFVTTTVTRPSGHVPRVLARDPDRVCKSFYSRAKAISTLPVA